MEAPTEPRLVVIGASAGGLDALTNIFLNLPPEFPFPIVVVQHLNRYGEPMLVTLLALKSKLAVKEAEDKEALTPGVVYVAPSNYHVLVERDFTLSLSVDPEVNFSRPSIDVLFESAAVALGKRVVGVLLTGANQDGARGIAKIKESGGLTIVEDPKTALFKMMPESALRACEVDRVETSVKIGLLLTELSVRGTTP